MNILKLKSILFSLMAITMVTVFLTSCEKEQKSETSTVEETSNSNLNNYVDQAFRLPKGYDQLSEDDINKYIANLTNQKMEQLIENHRIVEFLISTNHWDELNATLDQGDILSKENVAKHLTNEQLENLNKFTVNEQIDSRYCTGCNLYHSYCPVNGCIGVSGKWYPLKKTYKRYCSGYSYVCKVTCSN